MALAHRELTRALETKRQLEKLAEQAERFQSIAPVNIFAIQETARRMKTAKALTASHLYTYKAIQEAKRHMKAIQEAKRHMKAIQEAKRHMKTALAIQNTALYLEVPKVSLNTGVLFPYNINFTENFNNWVIPNHSINMSTLRIGISPINLSEPTTDIEGSNKNPNTTENDTDNIDQEIEFDKSSLEQNLLHFEITRLHRELRQDRRMILIVVLPTLGSYSVLLSLLEGSDSMWLPIISILGHHLLGQWSSEKD